ncbi:hypothetical protein ASPVEDRAFT_129041 [Aspergillus versicolor CBS 583.65]|uniref:Xylanolytic transcriptional activator regulatory domain-containing protein n=1 Tax=Aspergillus versicolor CBS 583.65 TaxID=1036611 RepID=A0A1L9PGZ6_ASPVE|nr:uncharacterized protein ASPVEDRAFT_129041 [Aspergillus versicolor CBS 583.65]OJJ00743.1 hypothetical protein ASPVEDRAFT_129041 [Aspergillus versicolor CBS 583.65]
MTGYSETDALHLPGFPDFDNFILPTDTGYLGDSTPLDNRPPEAIGVQQLFRQLDDMSKRLSSDIDNCGITSDFLDACLHEFFERVSPAFPVIHAPTFSSQRTIPPLLLNMVALGSLFVCLPNATRKGELLWRLGYTAVATSWRTLISLRRPHDRCDGVQVVLTALLGQTYALLSSNTEIRTTAFVFHGLGFYWARTCGMYSVRDTQTYIPGPNASEEDKRMLWEMWASSEVQRRAVLGHYILDGLISQASGSPTSARHLINQIGTACSDEVFSATTVEQWIAAISKSETVNMPMSKVCTALFDPGYSDAPLKLSSFSLSALVEALQSLVGESNEVTEGTFGVVSREQIIRALLTLYRVHVSFALASEKKVIRWHNVCMEIAAPSTALYLALSERYNIIPLPGGISSNGSTQVINLEDWAGSADAIRALLHAVAITRLVHHAPLAHSQAPFLPLAIFSAAMVFSAICLFGSSTLEIPSSPRWEYVWADGAPCQGDEFLVDLKAKSKGTSTSNLVNELNFLQLALKTVTSFWGISAEMERVVGHLAVLAHERHSASRTSI